MSNNTSHHHDERVSGLPGCGMALYAGLLLFIGFIGVVGMTATTWGLFQRGNQGGPRVLQPGRDLAVWQMSPIRKTRLVELNEVPLAFHDESDAADGTVACALMNDRAVRLDDGQTTVMRYDDMTSVHTEPRDDGGLDVICTGVDASGLTTTLPCRFREGEGGDRLARMLTAEVDARLASTDHPAATAPASQPTDEGEGEEAQPTTPATQPATDG